MELNISLSERMIHMQDSKMKVTRRKASVDQRYCVACGECLKHCKFGAISIRNGSYAIVDEDKCVGCKRCVLACPASTIQLQEVM